MAISDLKLPEGVNAHTFKNPATMAEGLAISVAAQLNQAIASQGVATLVVSGGRSPVAFFESLLGVNLVGSQVLFIDQLPSEVNVSDVLIIAAISLFLSFIATLYPSWRASRVNPAEALRYE